MRVKLFQFDTLALPAIVILIAFAITKFGDNPTQPNSVHSAPNVLDRTPIDEGLIAVEPFDYLLGSIRDSNGGTGWSGAWRHSRARPAEIAEFRLDSQHSDDQFVRHGALIRGTTNRNNPLRRELLVPYAQSELYFRFEFRYEQSSSQLVETNEGTEALVVDPEFFVCWLDRVEGADGATHATNVPNFGIHVASSGPLQGKNVFMLRVGVNQTVWTDVEFEYGKTYRLIGRLAKSSNDESTRYDRFDLWVDPEIADRENPDATLHDAPSLQAIHWIGFSSAVKTEAGDRIQVADLILGETWNSVVDVSEDWLRRGTARLNNYAMLERHVDFTEEIYPLLVDRCFNCHQGEQPDAGYRLDLRNEWLGYSNGEVLAEPGRSHLSRLVELVEAESELERMPPSGDPPLSEDEVVLLRTWIDQGMEWDDQLLPPMKRESTHWSFQPISRSAIPNDADPNWISSPVDAFISSTHRAHGLTHADPASKQEIIRRVYLDLIGLPPSPEQVQAFVDDDSPLAYGRLVDRLLASPHYGERWGRYWLDLARWAESQGYQHDIVRPYAWRYRDYVIDSLNNDKPYDRFILEQLAGDELQPYSDENLIATGFLAAARISGNEEDERVQRNDVLVDIVNATGSAFLGLTLECAQCHNHKIDPISQRDYYRMQAFFVRGQLGNLSLQNTESTSGEVEQWIPRDAFDFYQKEITTLKNKNLYRDLIDPHTWGFLSAETGDARIERLPVVNRKPIVWDPEQLKTETARILIRGEASNPGQIVEPGWPEAIDVTPSTLGDRPRTSLASWMGSPQNPLVARVWVNRIWSYHFGQGIVATESDFGVEGALPSHPELLDWLASELIDSGWSTKAIHRHILMSQTYRQKRSFDEANALVDPNNVLLWNWPSRRLEAEVIRDSVLVASGEIIRTVGGASVNPENEESDLRRTIYLFQQRSQMPTVMNVFDAPNGISSCSGREVSTVALQPLFLLNSDFMSRRAFALAQRCRSSAGDDIDQQIQMAFWLTLGRAPENAEWSVARQLYHDPSARDLGWFDDPDRPLSQLCLALMNINEFVYIP